jgi:tetratricopeptide (TPR) repeat protein
MKKFLTILSAAMTSLSAGAQNDQCAVNYSIYKEFLNVESYSNAVNTYRNVFADCPKFSKTVYIDGVKIYKGLIGKTTDESLINAYVDTIKIIYNKRIENYGEEAQCLSRMAFDVMKLRKSAGAYQEAFEIFEKSVSISGKSTDPATFTAYFQIAANLSAQKKLTNEKLFDVLVPNLLTIKKNVEIEKAEKIITTVSKYLPQLNCQEDFEKLFDEKYSVPEKSEDVVILSGIMTSLGCEGGALYAKCAEKLYEENPTAEAAALIARFNRKSKEYDKAAQYYSEAVSKESDNKKKAGYLYESALVANCQGKYSQAVSLAKKSLALNPQIAGSYLLIGAVYGSNANLFGKDDFDRRQIYWVAADYVAKAKKTDASLSEQADLLLKKYSALFPNKEDAFMHSVKAGDVVKVTAFDNETTTARFL